MAAGGAAPFGPMPWPLLYIIPYNHAPFGPMPRFILYVLLSTVRADAAVVAAADCDVAVAVVVACGGAIALFLQRRRCYRC